jgi:hypothetical protein
VWAFEIAYGRKVFPVVICDIDGVRRFRGNGCGCDVLDRRFILLCAFLLSTQTAFLTVVERDVRWEVWVCGTIRGKVGACCPFDYINQARLYDFYVAASEMGKSGEFEMTTISCWFSHTT